MIRLGIVNRKIFCADARVALAEYLPDEDDAERYDCWRDSGTEDGYNSKFGFGSFEEFCAWKHAERSRFYATIIARDGGSRVGAVFLSPAGSPPDLAIMIYPDFRHRGYGTSAFALAAEHCFSALKCGEIFAGCYEGNTASMKMLEKCGFTPHAEGNEQETHYLTGEARWQLDFVRRNTL